MEALVRDKIQQMDLELERLKRKGEDAERIRIHQNSLEEMRKTKKRKRSERVSKRKTKAQ